MDESLLWPRPKTPRTWPEGQAPTDEQWLDWLLASDREDQLTIARRVRWAMDAQARCLILGHDTLWDNLRAAGRSLSESHARQRRYRLAWLAARRWRQGFRRVVAEWEAEHP